MKLFQKCFWFQASKMFEIFFENQESSCNYSDKSSQIQPLLKNDVCFSFFLVEKVDIEIFFGWQLNNWKWHTKKISPRQTPRKIIQNFLLKKRWHFCSDLSIFSCLANYWPKTCLSRIFRSKIYSEYLFWKN